jgi:integrase
MTSSRRANGAGTVYIKHGSYYGRWYALDGGRSNRKLGPVRRPGSASGLTRAQAEKRLRDFMSTTVALAPDPERTIALLGAALLARLDAKGRSRSHIETVETHLRLHLVPFFGDRSIDRITEDHVTGLIIQLRRKGLAAKTIRNIASTLHSLFEVAIRKRWLRENVCSLVDLPTADASVDIRYLSQDELTRVIECGIDPGSPTRMHERALYLMAAMTGLRQGELLGLRWRDLDLGVQKVRVRQTFVRGEFKGPKSARGSRGVPLAPPLEGALRELRDASPFIGDDDLVFAHPATGGPINRHVVRRRFQRACKRAGVRVVRFHDLRHTFGTRVAASGEVSLRTLQEWMGHRDAKTTMIYADYQPGEREADIVGRAFR